MASKSWSAFAYSQRLPSCVHNQHPSTSLSCADEETKPQYDYTDEEVYFETPPHRGDLASNLVLGATVLWLPLTIASVARAAFVKYRFTTLRLSVTTNAPLRSKASPLHEQYILPACATPCQLVLE